MAGVSKVKLNLRGLNVLLKSMQEVVDDVGEGIASDADGNYRYVATPHRFTARGHVETADADTARKDAETAELLRALGRAIK